MFVRLVKCKIDLRLLEQYRQFYEKTIITKFQEMPGCQFVGLIQSSSSPEDFISMTFWDSRKNADKFEKSGIYQSLVQQSKPYFSESSEWKIELSKDLELKYQPISEEPVLKEYKVAAQTEDQHPEPLTNPRMYVRFVSIKVREGKEKEFKQIYLKEIIPALQKTKGCRFVYLTENLQKNNEFISVTIWDSKVDAEIYENSGQFNALVKKIKHTLSDLYQWKMALENETGKQIITSNDLSVSRYTLVTGKSIN
jgi:heme-degrading monooxygenase HmoA